MTETDFGTFERAFGRVSGAFRLKLKPSELEDLTRTYFRVLEAYSLDEVLQAGKQCLTKYRTFPKPADWLSELAADTRGTPGAAECRHMGSAELEEHERAERVRYADHPCLCSECCRAGVDDRPIRFVPTLFGDVEERAFNPRRKVVQIVGHWAHGEELARWYAARDRFFALAPAGVVRLFRGRDRRSFADRIEAIYRRGDREPGEEG